MRRPRPLSGVSRVTQRGGRTNVKAAASPGGDTLASVTVRRALRSADAPSLSFQVSLQDGHQPRLRTLPP